MKRRWPMPDQDEYQVGYGKPPKATQFKKGQSGNPKGRKKGSKNLKSALESALGEKVRITVNGVSRLITKMDAIVIQMTNKAASGDLRATHELINLLQALGREEKASQTDEPEVDEPMGGEVLDLMLSRLLTQPELVGDGEPA